MTKRTRRAVAVLSAVLLSAAAAAGCSGSPDTGGTKGPTGTKGTTGRTGGTGSTGSTATKASPGTTPTAGKGFTLVASGDVLPHTSIISAAATGGGGYDFKPMFSGVKDLVSAADLALCHSETVYGEEGGPFTGYPDFVSPPQVAEGLKDAGYDGCSTASNHTLDDGADGLKRTLDTFDKAGLKHAGSARTAAEAATVTTYAAGGAKVAHLAYTYDTNDHPMPEGQPWAVNLMEQEKIVADARAARKAGADVVLVSLHWGTEWQTAPDERQLTLGKALTASTSGGRPDIDMILGTHAHIPQAYEKVNGTWIIYGMGDQVAGEMFNDEGARDLRGNYGSIGRFTFAPPAAPGQPWRVTKAEYVPQMMDLAAGRVVNLPAGLAKDPDHEGYKSAEEAISEAVLSRGAARTV